MLEAEAELMKTQLSNIKAAANESAPDSSINGVLFPNAQVVFVWKLPEDHQPAESTVTLSESVSAASLSVTRRGTFSL